MPAYDTLTVTAPVTSPPRLEHSPMDASMHPKYERVMPTEDCSDRSYDGFIFVVRLP